MFSSAVFPKQLQNFIAEHFLFFNSESLTSISVGQVGTVL